MDKEERLTKKATGTQEVDEVEITRYENLPRLLRVVCLILWGLGIGMGVVYNFGLSFQGHLLLFDVAYYCLFLAVFSPCVFLILPGRKKDKRLPWYDLLVAAFIFCTWLYFFLNAWEISLGVWISIPLGIILVPLVLEGGRRTGGPFYLAICLIVVLYPLYADSLPGLLWGRGYSLDELTARLIFQQEGLLGFITKITAEVVLGFLVFAGVLVGSGAGAVFMNVATALLGRFRGGPAKVAVLASGLFGSLSGNTLSNVIATGSFTIPTMKRLGYPGHYAAAIEACASTGGMLMPPVMGAVAFIMAELLGIPYAVIIAAAAIPAVLYYFGLLLQVDSYAARVGLIGLPREEIPSLSKTLKEAWPFIVVFLFLIWGLIYMRWERLAPWYATGIMLLLSFRSKKTMLTPRRMIHILATVGDLVTRTMAIVLPIAFIFCGLLITGFTLSFTATIVNLGGESTFFILIMGVIACYIMGMAGLVYVAYIFLAVTLAPAVLQVMDLNILAVHLFIIYYAMLAVFTPPVADAAFIAATIARASPMKTAFLAMRLGIVIYFIPFFFVFNPALVLQGSPLESLYLFALCLVGIVLIAGGCEGYLLKVGVVKLWARPLLVISGLLIGFPEWKTTIIGATLGLLVIAIIWRTRSMARRR